MLLFRQVSQNYKVTSGHKHVQTQPQHTAASSRRGDSKRDETQPRILTSPLACDSR
jgi:hypothetical protein